MRICVVLAAAWVLVSVAVGIYVALAPRRGQDGLWGEGDGDPAPRSYPGSSPRGVN